MPMEINDDKVVMRAGKYKMPYVMTAEDVELLKWAIDTLSDFAVPDRPGRAYRFVYVPRLTDLRNLVQQIEGRMEAKA